MIQAIIKALRNRLSGTANPAKWLVDTLTGGVAGSGVTVNEHTALTYSAVWCATRIISETIASLPLILYRRWPDGRGRERDQRHPLFPILRDEPNPEMDSFAYWAMQVSFLVNWGNAYAEIERDRLGRIVALWPLHAANVTPQRSPSGAVEYEVRNYSRDGQSPIILPSQRVFHLCGSLSENGIAGRGVLRQARESIGMGMATERFGAAFFGNGARPGGVLTHPGNPSEKAERAITSGWEKMHQGPDKGSKIALLREGMQYDAIGIPPEDAQFLQTRQHNITEIARWYGVPPHMLGDLSKATFSNIEEQALEFVVHSIRPWLVRIERAIKRQLIQRKDEMFCEFLLDALLRGDKPSRTEALTKEFLNVKITLNEWRALDNQNPIESAGGDVHFVPLNLTPLERATEPPPEPEEPPEPEVEPEAEPGEESEGMAAALAVLAEVRGRMVRKEQRAIRRAANNPKTFLAKVDAFYGNHELLMTEAIAPAVRMLRAVGGDGDAAVIARDHCAEHRQALLTASECLPAQLATNIQNLTKGW